MPTRRPPASGEMPSLAIAMRMRLRAFFVISMAALARGCCPSAVSSVMPASGSVGAEAAGLGAEVPGWRRVVGMKLFRLLILIKEYGKQCPKRPEDRA